MEIVIRCTHNRKIKIKIYRSRNEIYIFEEGPLSKLKCEVAYTKKVDLNL